MISTELFGVVILQGWSYNLPFGHNIFCVKQRTGDLVAYFY
jgi:hypothetical protein